MFLSCCFSRLACSQGPLLVANLPGEVYHPREIRAPQADPEQPEAMLLLLFADPISDGVATVVMVRSADAIEALMPDVEKGLLKSGVTQVNI